VDRIVSLLPSTTEIACALGFREALVGRSHECDHPADVVALPALTEPKLDPRAPSRAIDERVKSLVRDGLSVYRVDADRLRELAPDVILTQDHCQVCAASLEDVESVLAQWLGERPRVVSLEPRALGDVFASFQRVANALGAPERGQELTADLSGRLIALAERAQQRAERPRVACIEWIDPLMAAGNWMPELVTLAGGTSLFATLGEPSPWLAWQALRDADPDVIVVLPCGFDLARTRAELAPLRAQPGFAALRAVRAGRVFLADGHQYFNRPGPRLIESLAILCELLHPEEFHPTHRGVGWEPLAPG
jgi:iron complex transport system substrate-binding protein